MDRKVYLNLKARVVVRIPDDMEVQDFVDQLEWVDGSEECEIEDAEVQAYEIEDSK